MLPKATSRTLVFLLIASIALVGVARLAFLSSNSRVLHVTAADLDAARANTARRHAEFRAHHPSLTRIAPPTTTDDAPPHKGWRGWDWRREFTFNDETYVIVPIRKATPSEEALLP